MVKSFKSNLHYNTIMSRTTNVITEYPYVDKRKEIKDVTEIKKF